MRDGEVQRCQKRCQKETGKIHSRKKESQTSEKAEITEQPYEVRLAFASNSSNVCGRRQGYFDKSCRRIP
jgi:hypothetical protein